MAKQDSTCTKKAELQNISHALHKIAARMAGIESILRNNVEDPDGNAMFLLAEITQIQNSEICQYADRIWSASETAAEATA